jgi:kinetochore protein Nuf2
MTFPLVCIINSGLLQRALNDEINVVSDTIARTRSRIVQSPERIKRTITVMGETAIEDKRTVAMLETKSRDLQTKINALLNIEKVRLLVSFTCRQGLNDIQDVRSCVEQLQTVEKEVQSLEASQKELADLKDHLDEKKIERSELNLKHEVCLPPSFPYTINLKP